MKILAVSCALVVLAAGSAWAEQTKASGTITDLDSGKHQLVLSDGQTYTLPANFKADGFKVGDRVAVVADKQDGANIVQQVAKAN